MNFVKEMRNAVNKAHNAVVAAEQAMTDFQNRYSAVYSRQEFDRRMGELTAARDAAVGEGNNAIFALTRDFIDSISNIDDLNGDELTADAKLLESAIPLTKSDLEAMFDRNQGNRTMQQLVMRKAAKDAIVFERHFYTRTEIEDAARSFERTALYSVPSGDYFDIVWSNDANFKKIVPAALWSL